jgi:prepilin-type N-terminal cleavage/methylation domain-containing protein
MFHLSRISRILISASLGVLAGNLLFLLLPYVPSAGRIISSATASFGGDTKFLILYFLFWSILGGIAGAFVWKKTKDAGAVSPNRPKTGFTLIELLVVIAIIAILSVVIILTLNPAELLKQARDSTRMSDISALKSALLLYLSEGGSLGTSGVSYLSVPDSNSNCSGLSLPAGSWGCANSSNYRKVDGTGWIPVNFGSLSIKSPLSALPVDPQNGVSTSHYTYSTDGSGFLVTAAPESSKYGSTQSNLAAFTAVGGSNKLIGGNFPDGWVLVPGNSTFGTPSFWVMKYEAKCISGTTPLTSPSTGYNTYDNASQPCTGSYYIASTANGYPIANISHDTAVSYCQSIGAHLLTNDEWMTIARNAEQVGSNWSGGSPGSGYLPRGNSDSSAAQDGSSQYGTGYSDFTHLRTLTLSNGSVIWDIAGNVWEHVERSVNNAGDVTTTMALPACSNSTAGWEWCEYASPGSPYVSAWSSDVAQAKVGPSNASWYSAQGTGQVLTYGTGANQGTTVFLRGGNWYLGTYAGAFALNLYWGTGTTGSHVGFRCAR